MIVIGIILGVYSVLLIALNVGWQSLNGLSSKDAEVIHDCTIIVPFRNEERNIEKIFIDLQHQDFPADKAEIIFVDDHSTDASIEVLEKLLRSKNTRISSIILKSGREGKKAALQLGIESAKGTVILTTDADCSVSQNWLKSISSYYANTDTQMVFGPVTFIDEKTFFEKLQTIEFASLIGVGAASLALGLPNMCNGANLSFRKEAFNAVGGYTGNEHIASGDDEFLMHKLHKKYPGGIIFSKLRDALVQTKAHKQWSGFFQQRKRWASKWRLYADFKTTLLALFVALVNISFILAVAGLMLNLNAYSPLIVPVLIKVILEFVFLFKVLNFLDKKLNIFHFVFLQFTYPFYVLLFGIAANFGRYTWKGRKH